MFPKVIDLFDCFSINVTTKVWCRKCATCC